MSSLKTQRLMNDNHGIYSYDRIDSPHLIGGNTEDSNSTCLQHVNQPIRSSSLKKSCKLHAPQPVKVNTFEPAASSMFFDSIPSSDSEDSHSSEISPECNESDNADDLQSELTKIFTGFSNAAFGAYDEDYAMMPGFNVGYSSHSIFGEALDSPTIGMSPRLSKGKASMEDSMPVLGFSPGPMKCSTRPPSRAPNPCSVKERIDMDAVMDAVLQREREEKSRNWINVQQQQQEQEFSDDFADHDMFAYYRSRRNSEPFAWIPIGANSDM